MSIERGPVLYLLLASVSFSAASAQIPTEVIVERSVRSVVLITTNAGQGSGFLVSRDGIILTNHHVVAGARTAVVQLSNGDEFGEVEVLAEDATRDVAVLRIPGSDYPALVLGNSDATKIGASVIAIGSPLGLTNTVSTGVLSGKRRFRSLEWLQTTAPISPGSSGGPLLDSDGMVVGITTSGIESGQNLNFAVPINHARTILEDRNPSAARALAPLLSGNFEYYYEKDPFTGEVVQLITANSKDVAGSRESATISWYCSPSGKVGVALGFDGSAVRTVRWKIDDNPPSDPGEWNLLGRNLYTPPPWEAVLLTSQALPGHELIVRLQQSYGNQTDLTFSLEGLTAGLRRLPCGPQGNEDVASWRGRREAERQAIEAARATEEVARMAATARVAGVAAGDTVRISTCEVGILVLLKGRPGGLATGDMVPGSDICVAGLGAKGEVLDVQALHGLPWFEVKIIGSAPMTGWVPADVVNPVEGR